MSPDRFGKIGQPEDNGEAAQGGVKEELVCRGISASPGIVIATAFLKDSELLVVPKARIDEALIDDEAKMFEQTLEDTRTELLGIRGQIAEQMGEDHARIFDAHMLILDDNVVTEGTVTLIRDKQMNAAAAFNRVMDHIIDSFSQIEDEYLKDRYVDVKDIKRRVTRKLLGKENVAVDRPDAPAIIVAHDLSPSDTAQLGRRNVLGFATDLGGRTSHVALLARPQGVPAVVGLESLFTQVETGDRVVVDGNTGRVVINPTAETIEDYEHEIRRFKELEEQLLTLTGYPAATIDEAEFMLTANIDMPEETESVLEYGGQGIGLLRTEYFFISQEFLPSEEDQYKAYRSVVEKMGDKPVVIRTLDIGGDKIASYLPSAAELNPFMGWRGIRFCLTRQDIFKAQLRAIYRASAHGNVKIMLPMISQLEEVIKTKVICQEVKDDLSRERIEFDDTVELGIMIETPSAVAMADQLAKECDFFSIGTNDLIQYTLAVDRGNSKIAYLYQNLHPSIIRFLKQTTDAAHKRDIKVSVCGEMAGDPYSILVLIGLGIDQFSCSPNMMPEVKRIIRSVTKDECRALVRRLTRHRLTAEIEREIEKFLKSHVLDGSVGEKPN